MQHKIMNPIAVTKPGIPMSRPRLMTILNKAAVMRRIVTISAMKSHIAARSDPSGLKRATQVIAEAKARKIVPTRMMTTVDHRTANLRGDSRPEHQPLNSSCSMHTLFTTKPSPIAQIGVENG